MNEVDQWREFDIRGAFRQDGKHSWQIQMCTGCIRGDGKQTRRFVTVPGRRGDAEVKKNELLAALARGRLFQRIDVFCNRTEVIADESIRRHARTNQQ